MPEYKFRHDEGTFSSLTKYQKETVGLLSIGTFLEYLPIQYLVVSLLSVAISLGTVFALCVATFAASIGINWRIAFLIVASISFSRRYS